MIENEYRNRYAVYGAGFGLLFPVGSTLLQAAVSPHGISLAGIAFAQSSALLWVIDSAPLWLGLFASFAGKRQDALADAMAKLEVTNLALGDSNSKLEGANSQLAETNDDLIQASQLKSQFLANMSHELRTPLNAIIGFSRILIKKTAGMLPDRQAKNLRMVHESGQHLLELVNDILDIERIEAGMLNVRTSQIDVIAMAADVVAKLTPAAEDKGLSATATLPSGSLVMSTDPVRLRQLLDNLVNNAIKYSDEGKIELEVRSRSKERPNDVCFCVRDQGIGIPEAVLPDVFDAFHQVDGSTTRAQGGVGLGLHLVKKIAGLLGGDVSVQSKLGKGSIFTLSLPADLILTEDGDAGPSIDTAPQGEGPVLLIVDDTESVVEIMRSELVDAGFRVHVALSGEEGLEKAREVRPDAMLLDIIMPGMDGWAVLKALRLSPELSSTPVIITSQLDASPKAAQFGAVAWMTKPISPEEFRDIFDLHGVASHDDVLVVEDDPATAEMIMQNLGELSVEARHAIDGEAAIRAMTDRLPKAVILDIMLPKFDGFEVLEKLRQMDGGLLVPVIVYTAKDLTDAERDRLKGGTIDVVGKGQQDGLGHVVEKVRSTLAKRTNAGSGAKGA